MDNIIQETIQYTRQRKIFKQPVLYHQAVHFRLAELQTEVELLRSLLHRATGKVTLQIEDCRFMFASVTILFVASVASGKAHLI